MLAVRVTPAGRTAVEEMARQRKERVADTLRAMLKYAIAHMPKDYR
jgi:hypothetical protein